VDDSSPAESPRTSTTGMSDASSLADEECRDQVRDGRSSHVKIIPKMETIAAAMIAVFGIDSCCHLIW